MADGSEIVVTFPAGVRADARAGAFEVRTDQPREFGGDDSAPAPFTLFLSSLATCAGFFVVRFCRARGLDTAGVRVVQRSRTNPELHTLAEIDLDIEVPPSFPERYREALVRAVDQCSVKRAIEARPAFVTRTVVTGG